jgi:FAD/FMN-containing dehydrogenase
MGWELRMHPSTKRQSALGGYLAGGAAGVGSVMHGQLRDWGSIPGIRVATCEPVPRIFDFRGRDVANATHAYGTTGAPHEHAGFGRFAADAKDRGTAFLAATLLPRA